MQASLLEAALHLLHGLVSFHLGELPNAENELKVIVIHL
jgi:hypothetical protein